MQFINFIQFCIKKRKLLLLSNCIILGCIFSLLLILPKTYTSHTTFFLKENNQNTSSQIFQAIGFNNTSNLENYIHEIISSYKIKKLIAKKFQNNFPNTPVNEILSKELNLKKNTKLSKNNYDLFKLTVSAKEPQIAFKIINEYIYFTEKLNEELNFSPNKELLIILDTPTLSKLPSNPNKKLLFALSIFVIPLSSSIFFFYIEKFTEFLKKLEKMY